MDWGLFIILVLVGILVAIPSSMVGLGGGILFIPILILFLNVPPNEAIAISLFAMLGNTLSCSIVYIVHRKINYKLAFLYDVMDVPGVFLGAWLTTVLVSNFLMGICGFIILFMGLSLLRRSLKKSEEEDLEEGLCIDDDCEIKSPEQIEELHSITAQSFEKNPPEIYQKHKFAWISFALLSSFASGLVSGLAGVGGGTTDTTTMILLGVPPHVAGPTSEFAMAATNIVAVIAHLLMGNVNWGLTIPITIGAVAGAQIGARLCKYVKPIWLLRILIIFALFTSVRLILGALGIFPV